MEKIELTKLEPWSPETGPHQKEDARKPPSSYQACRDLFTASMTRISNKIDRTSNPQELLDRLFNNKAFLTIANGYEDKINQEWLRPSPDMENFKTLVKAWEKTHFFAIERLNCTHASHILPFTIQSDTVPENQQPFHPLR